MPFCKNCGKQINSNSKYCIYCGKEAYSNYNPSGSFDKRRQVYAGEVKKCPSCGETIPSLVTVCPTCGQELHTSVNKSLDILIESLNHFNSVNLSDVNVFISIIEHYQVPSDRESLLEFMFFIRDRVASLSKQKNNEVNRRIMRAWTNKAENVHKKLDLILPEEKLDDTIYGEILQDAKRFRRKRTIKWIFIIVFIVLLILLFFLNNINSSCIDSNCLSYLNCTNCVNGCKESLAGPLEEYNWPNNGLCQMIPKPDSDFGEIESNNSELFMMEAFNLDHLQFESYINSCKEKGFFYKTENRPSFFEAYDSEGYHLEINYKDYGYRTTMSITLSSPEKMSDLIWEDYVLADQLPKPDKLYGIEEYNTEKFFVVYIDGVSKEDYQKYVDSCKKEGFTLYSDQDGNSFKAYNEEKYCLEIGFEDLEYTARMKISLDAPMKMEPIRWPTIGLAKEIPKPKKLIGNIEEDETDSFCVYIDNTSQEEYNNYVDTCIKEGFNIEHKKRETSFQAKNEDGYLLFVEYNTPEIMYIKIISPENWLYKNY